MQEAHNIPKYDDVQPTEAEIASVLSALEAASFVDPLPQSAFGTNALSASDQYVLPDRMTDLVFAEYFMKLNTEKVRFWHTPKEWIDYDGKRWEADSPGGPYKYIKPMLEPLIEAAKLIPDEKKRAAILKALFARESTVGQKNLIDMAGKLPQGCIATEKLDEDQWFLNCRNGTIDLKTGKLRPHRYDDYITKMVEIDHDATATCPQFIEFLSRIFDNDAELISYIQRWFGYNLTGCTSEQIVNMWHGSGANGKSVLSNVLGALLGEYAKAVGSFLLLQKLGGGGDNTTQAELAKLKGVRVARISEIDEGSRLAEAQLKNITGGEPVTCRALYRMPFEYIPAFKITLSCNHLPNVRNTDNGIWRRIHKIPFKVTIPKEEQDKELFDKLRGELPGILNWAIAGCLEWQKTGLNPPAIVIDATSNYKSSEDVFSCWLNDCCLQQDGIKSPAKNLLESFKTYSGWKNTSHKKFGTLLTEHGFEKSKSNGVVWHGLEPLEPSDTVSEKSGDVSESGNLPNNALKGSNSSVSSMYADML